jgi:outer membrane murein-binding lipoprotein Lpp
MPLSTQQQIDALAARVTTLEATVASLQTQVTAALAKADAVGVTIDAHEIADKGKA